MSRDKHQRSLSTGWLLCFAFEGLSSSNLGLESSNPNECCYGLSHILQANNGVNIKLGHGPSHIFFNALLINYRISRHYAPRASDCWYCTAQSISFPINAFHNHSFVVITDGKVILCNNYLSLLSVVQQPNSGLSRLIVDVFGSYTIRYIRRSSCLYRA